MGRQEQHAEAERVFRAAAIPGGPARAIVGLAKSQSGQGVLHGLSPFPCLPHSASPQAHTSCCILAPHIQNQPGDINIKVIAIVCGVLCMNIWAVCTAIFPMTWHTLRMAICAAHRGIRLKILPGCTNLQLCFVWHTCDRPCMHRGVLPLAGKSQEAASSYCRAIEMCPDASKLWDSLAMLLTVLGKFEHADAAARHDPAALKSVLIRA